MIKHVCAVLAMTAMLAAGPAGAQGLLVAPNAFNGSTPVEVLDAAPSAMEGQLKSGQAIAQHRVRALEAVVTTAAVKAKHRDIPAGTALARVDTDKGAYWCDARPTGIWSLGNTDCLTDTDGDGRLDRLATGKPASFKAGLTVSQLYDEAKEPRFDLAARPAAPQERPVEMIGYVYCEGNGVSGPPRFSSAVSDDGASWDYAGCSFGQWPNSDDKSSVKVDQLQLTVTPTADGLAYKVANRIAPGSLAPLVPAQPFLAADQAPSKAQAALAKAAELSQEILVPTGAAIVNTGAIKKGGVVLSVPVAYGVTGRLENEVKPLGLFARGQAPLPVGQPVYGVPMGSFRRDDADVIWCALRSETDKKGKRKFSTLCLPKNPMGYNVWLSGYPALLVTSLEISNATSGATAPSVHGEPVDFGVKLRLDYRVGSWRKDYMTLEAVLVTEDGISQSVGWALAVILPGQDATLNVLGGALSFKQTDGGAMVQIKEPLKGEGRLPL